MVPTLRSAGTGGDSRPAGKGPAVNDAPTRPRRSLRWECPCQLPPVLLATVDATGTLNLKLRDRYYHIEGARVIRATCPRCGRVHTLDVGRLPAG